MPYYSDRIRLINSYFWKRTETPTGRNENFTRESVGKNFC